LASVINYGHIYADSVCLQINGFTEREVNLIPDVSQALSWLEAHPQAL